MRKFIIYLVLIIFGLFLVSCNSLCDECIDINKDYICDECGGSIGRTGPIIDSYFKVEVTGAKDSLVENLKSLYKAGEKVEKPFKAVLIPVTDDDVPPTELDNSLEFYDSQSLAENSLYW